jgi:predicted HTH transcriptional regulator
MIKPTKPSLTYLKFLNLVQSVRELPDFPLMDAVEERMMNLFAASWQRQQPVTVLQAMEMLQEISASTAHRRLKALRKKGLITLQIDQIDNRIKYVVPTDLVIKYFTHLGQCLVKAVGR